MTRLAFPVAAALIAGAMTAQAQPLTVHAGVSCIPEGAVLRPVTGALLSDNVGHGTRLFHCPVPRVNPTVTTTALSVTLNAVRNGMGVTYSCELRSVNAQGAVQDTVWLIVPPWNNQGSTYVTTTSSPLTVHFLNSVSLRCNVPDRGGAGANAHAGIVSYIVSETY